MNGYNILIDYLFYILYDKKNWLLIYLNDMLIIYIK
jgi:hypothetical protein